jgi:hypothetical protein
MGGYAIQGVRKITGDEARQTLSPLKRFLDHSKVETVMLIGSAWHREEGLSGDLDLGVRVDPKQDFTWVMSAKLGKTVQGKAMPGISVYSFGFPICGKAINGMVQVDLIPVYYPEWSKFVYAKVTGKAKSAHRNWLLCALAKSRGVKFDLNKGAMKAESVWSSSVEITSDPDEFLKWLGITRADADSYETLSQVVPQEVLYEANEKLAAVK